MPRLATMAVVACANLEHGEAVVALANAQRDGFARIPALLLGALVGAPFQSWLGSTPALRRAGQCRSSGRSRTEP